METMAHGWFLAGSLAAIVALLSLLRHADGEVAWARFVGRLTRWESVSRALRLALLIAVGAMALSLLLNVIRYAKGGA